MDPGEDPVCESVDVRERRRGVVRQCARDEEWFWGELGKDVVLPVPCRRVSLEGTQHRLSLDMQLGRVGGVLIRKTDNHCRVRDRGEVEADKKLEVEGLCLRVKCVKLCFKPSPVGVPAPVIDGEGIDSGTFGKLDVIDVATIGGLFNEHIVGEHKRGGGSALVQILR